MGRSRMVGGSSSGAGDGEGLGSLVRIMGSVEELMKLLGCFGVTSAKSGAVVATYETTPNTELETCGNLRRLEHQ